MKIDDECLHEGFKLEKNYLLWSFACGNYPILITSYHQKSTFVKRSLVQWTRKSNKNTYTIWIPGCDMFLICYIRILLYNLNMRLSVSYKRNIVYFTRFSFFSEITHVKIFPLWVFLEANILEAKFRLLGDTMTGIILHYNQLLLGNQACIMCRKYNASKISCQGPDYRKCMDRIV